LLAFKETLDLDTMTGLRRITLRLGSDQQRLAIIETENDAAPELETDLPMSVNLLRSDGLAVNLVGDLHTQYVINGRSFRVSAGCDFRANLSQVGRLVNTVMDALSGRESVLDLYAGVGLFSSFIAQRARLVTLVEADIIAVNDAELNLADVDNVDIIEGLAEDVLESLEDEYDAALLDAPQSGLSKVVIDELIRRGIPRLVYISRDPATLARDGKRLANGGYQLTSVQPIDLSPQTYFIDTIAIFDHRKKPQ
jgi:23S rRNA (uracil1939-C5)-methyltransferase